MWTWGLKSSLPFSTVLLWNEGQSVPMSPKSTMSPFSTCRFAISAASLSTASTSAPVNVVACPTSSQKLRWSTRELVELFCRQVCQRLPFAPWAYRLMVCLSYSCCFKVIHSVIYYYCGLSFVSHICYSFIYDVIFEEIWRHILGYMTSYFEL